MRWTRDKHAGKNRLGMKELRRRFCDKGRRFAYNGVVRRIQRRGDSLLLPRKQHPDPMDPPHQQQLRVDNGHDTPSARCGESRTARRVREGTCGKRPAATPALRTHVNLTHNRVGRTLVTSADEFNVKIVNALRRLQNMPHPIRAFFGDPAATSPRRQGVSSSG